MRIDKAISRTKSAAKNVIDAQLRHHLYDVFRRNPFDVGYAQRDLPLTIRFQISKVILSCRAEKITMRAIVRWVTYDFIKAREEVDSSSATSEC